MNSYQNKVIFLEDIGGNRSKNSIVFRATNYPPNIGDYIDVELNKI